ncbi:hypothetical protein P167DRAFT_287029 [Morchella conica CCBAS932]|uniref:Uncharacterized protein n=1 Tax=Morchella conica CCBAS932 TaxID=1392247 RepID=A0A3N4KGY6_9PEZI|nr:hypothetical protein P167DRAFT_287029 [Morchella conica CCBAS932]
MPPMWALSPSPSDSSTERSQSSSPDRITSASPNGSRRILPRIPRKVGAIIRENERKHTMDIEMEISQNIPAEAANGSTKRRRSTSIDTVILSSKIKTSDQEAMPHHANNNEGFPPSPHKARKKKNIPSGARKPNPYYNYQLGPKTSEFFSGPVDPSKFKTGHVSGLLGIKAKPTFNPMLYHASLQQCDSSKVTAKNLTPSWFHYPSVSSNLENSPRFQSSSIYYSSREEYETVNRIDKAGFNHRVLTQRKGSAASLTTEEGYSTDRGIEDEDQKLGRGGKSYEKNEMDTEPAKQKELDQQKEARARAWVESNCDDDLGDEDNYNTRCSGKLGKVITDLQNAVRLRAEAANQELEHQSSN